MNGILLNFIYFEILLALTKPIGLYVTTRETS
jgi:hypothetical protein